MESRIGQQFGNYRLVRLLGQGGFAEVYLGEHLLLKDRRVAIKVLSTPISNNEAQTFLEEGRIISTLKHHNILLMLDIGFDSRSVYLVTEYAPGGSLRERYPRGSILPMATILSYVKQIAAALQYAHGTRIIHRDVKPENILIGADGRTLLSDFGIATLVGSSSLANSQSVTGTLGYMAPEQFQGHPERASDQYALGIIVYEWLGGTRPFNGSFVEIATQHMLSQPPSLREKGINLSQAVEEVVLRALAKNPRDRFPTVEDFAFALEYASAFNTSPGRLFVPAISSPEDLTGANNPREEHNPPPASSQEDLEETAATLSMGPWTLSSEVPDSSVTQKHFSPASADEPDISAQETWEEAPESLRLPHAQTGVLTNSVLPENKRRDFFISYNRADRAQAMWLAGWLQDAGYSVLLPPVDFRMGFIFRNEMRKALIQAKHMLIVLTPAYLAALKSRSSGFSAFKRAAAQKQNALFSICIHSHDSLLKELEGIANYIDLTQENESMARAIFLAYIRGEGIEEFLSVNASLGKTEQPLEPERSVIYSQVFMSAAHSEIVQQATVSFAKKDWLDVTRKIDFLLKKRPDAITSKICQMQGQAFLALDQKQQAYEAFQMALTLANDKQRLELLEDCVKVLTSLERWGEILEYTDEASRLASPTTFWVTTRKQAFAHLTQTKQPLQSEPVREPKTTSNLYPNGIEVFFSYSHKDEEMRQELEKHLSNLKRQRIIAGWHDGEIRAGDVWEEEIEAHLRSAHIILLLVSPDFIDSKYCYEKEMLRAMQRHKAGEAHVIPIILRPAHWERTPFGKLQALPPGAKPLTLWANRDEAFVHIAKGIQKIIDGLTRNASSLPPVT